MPPRYWPLAACTHKSVQALTGLLAGTSETQNMDPQDVYFRIYLIKQFNLAGRLQGQSLLRDKLLKYSCQDRKDQGKPPMPMADLA